jgi:hypothetical protein
MRDGLMTVVGAPDLVRVVARLGISKFASVAPATSAAAG